MRLKAEKYILSVGRLNIRKNLGFLIRSCEDFPILGDDALVVVGEVSGKNEIESLTSVGPRIEWLGNVTDGELRWLYEHADMLVFPSLDEGYGLPPIEASQFGCRVIVSDIPVFREVLGTDAEYFDPTAPESLFSAVLKVRRESRTRNPHHGRAWADVVRSMRTAIVSDAVA
jgi:glycosyltransferase involved in cell wall biosynthesis